MQEALVDARPVEVRQAHHGRLDLSLGVRRKDQVFLRLAHATLEGVRLTRMVLADGRRSREPVRIDRADQDNALDARRDGALQRLSHQLRMQLELPVIHTDQVD